MSVTTTFKLGLLERGVTARAVYSFYSLDTLDFATEFIEAVLPAGEETRVVRALPMDLRIIDRRVACLSLQHDQTGLPHQYLLVHRSSLLDSLVLLFESVWQRAVPFRPGAQVQDTEAGPETMLSATDQKVLSLLGAGMKDAAIASQLGVGERTAARRVRKIMDKLGTDTGSRPD